MQCLPESHGKHEPNQHNALKVIDATGMRYWLANGSHVRNIFYKSNAKGSDRQSFLNDGFFGKNGIFYPILLFLFNFGFQ